MQYACAVLLTVSCPALHYFCTLSLKKILNVRCVFWFPVRGLSETFPLLRRDVRDVIKKMYIGLHLKYPLFMSACNETGIFPTDFQKILKCQISWKSIKWEPSCSMRTA